MVYELVENIQYTVTYDIYEFMIITTKTTTTTPATNTKRRRSKCIHIYIKCMMMIRKAQLNLNIV